MAEVSNQKWIIIGSILMIALVSAAVYKSKDKKKGIRVKTTHVKKRTIREIVSASGKIFPVKEVKISSDVSGEIVALYVKEGDSVHVGQVLAKIDADSYRSAVERGAAGLNNAKATHANSMARINTAKAQKEQIVSQLENTKQIHNRNIKLKDEGIISIADYEKSMAAVKSHEANLRSAMASVQSAIESANAAQYNIKSAEAGLNELRTSLKRTTIVSPYNGIISKLAVEKGERVVGTIQMSGTEMMRIANLQNMQVDVEVSENDILRVNLRDSVEIEVDAYANKKFRGRVTQIANSAANVSSMLANSNQVTNFIVEIAVDPRSYVDLVTSTNPFPFRPGMSATVDIYTDKKSNVLSIPIQAVTVRDVNKTKREDDEDIKEQLEEGVFVMESDTARFVIVNSGLQDDEFIQIIDGLSEDQVVVKGPYAVISKKLETGKVIKLKKKKKNKSFF